MSQAGEIDVINSNPQIPTMFITDSGTAIPIANEINIVGAGGIVTSGSGNTITITGGATIATTYTANTGTATPALNNINILGASVAALGVPVATVASGSTVTLNVQRASAAIASSSANAGIASFDSAAFSVDVSGFVTLKGGGEAIDSIGVDATSGTGTNPVVPTIAGLITVNGAVVAAGTNPIRTVSTLPNTYQIQNQISQAIAATDATKIGLANFDSAAFDVDANGFVQLNGGGIAATAFDVQANTAPGTDPVVPTAAGVVVVNGAVVANHSVVLETRSRAANAYNLEVQYAAAAAATDGTKSGVAHFNSAQFTVDASGFVATSGTGVGNTITGDSGGALSPTAGNWNIIGGTVAAGTSPLKTAGSGSTLTINAQRSQALASADATKVGLSNFNSAQFSVDANGFVSAAGTVAITTTENSGTATPSSGNLNIFGTNSALTGYSPWTTGSGATATINMPGTVKWVVNSTANLGTHTTIQAAITAAASGDDVFITPGTYTENLTLKVGVNLVAYDGDSSYGTVKIIGKSTLSTAGSCSISNIYLQTNSDFIVAVTVAGSPGIVYLNNCYLNMSNNTGLSISGSAAGSAIQCLNCFANLGTTGIGYFAISFGTISLLQCNFQNSGNSTTASTGAGSNILIIDSYLFAPVTTSSASAVQIFGSNIDCRVINATPLTHGGSGANSYTRYSFFDGGTASALSVGATLDVVNSDFTSSNTNALTGAGTINLYDSGLIGTSKKSNVTTQTGGAASGLTQGTAPSAGFIGESIVATASAVATVNTTAKTIASITLTPGIWDVSCIAAGEATGGTAVMTAMRVNISTTDNTIVGTLGIDYSQINVTGGTPDLTGVVPPIRKTISASTTYYLVVQNFYTSTTCPTNGRINATRVG